MVQRGSVLLWTQPPGEQTPFSAQDAWRTGDNLASLLSFLNILSGGDSRFVSLSAAAGASGATMLGIRVAPFQAFGVR